MSHVLELVTLQALDSDAASLVAALADVERRLAGDEALAEARAALAAAEAALAASRSEQRRLDGEVAGYTAKIEPEEKRLYDGSVRNPKELASIQHEVELLKAARGKLEDELLDVLARVEQQSGEREQAAAAVAAHEARRAGEVAGLDQDAARLRTAIAAAEVKVGAQRSKTPPAWLRAYDDVCRRKSGMGVARISGGSCGGCRITLPDQLRRRALNSETPVQCPNCDRILYVG